MGIKIKNMTTGEGGESIVLRDEYDAVIEARVIASDSGETIANHDKGERWAAIVITDYGDGNAEYNELSEGSTFGVTCRDEYVVKRTDNAGSLKWVEAGRSAENIGESHCVSGAADLGMAARDAFWKEFGNAPFQVGPNVIGDWDSTAWGEHWKELKRDYDATDEDYEECLKAWREAFWSKSF